MQSSATGKRVFRSLCFAFSLALLSPADGLSQRAVRIGIVTDLSAAGAYIGTQVRRGAELARLDLAGQHKSVELIFGDHASNPARSVTEAQKLITYDKVDAIFSTFSAASRAISPVAMRAGKLFLYSAGASSIVASNPYAFKTYSDYVDGCRRVARYWKDSGLVRIGLLKPESEFGEVCLEGLRAIDKDPLVLNYALNEPVLTQVMKLKAAGVQAFLNPSFEGDIKNTLAAARQLHYVAVVGVPEDSITGGLAAEFPEELQGVTAFGLPRPGEAFVQRFRSAYPDAPSGAIEFAGLAWLHVGQLYEASAACAAGDLSCQADTLKRSPAAPMVGFLQWSESRIARFDTAVSRWNRGAFVHVNFPSGSRHEH